MTESPRLEELRRRVERDPASIAFAALAEEYRRAGRFQEAVDVCRAGLRRHPVYLSARVTLGRALLELGEDQEARREFEQVLQVAPDNLAALQGVDETFRSVPHQPPGIPSASPVSLTSPARPADTVGAVAPSPGNHPASSQGVVLARLEALLQRIRQAREAPDPPIPT